MVTTEPGVPLVVETDTSNITVVAAINQDARPATFSLERWLRPKSSILQYKMKTKPELMRFESGTSSSMAIAFG